MSSNGEFSIGYRYWDFIMSVATGMISLETANLRDPCIWLRQEITDSRRKERNNMRKLLEILSFLQSSARSVVCSAKHELVMKKNVSETWTDQFSIKSPPILTFQYILFYIYISQISAILSFVISLFSFSPYIYFIYIILGRIVIAWIKADWPLFYLY